MLREAGGGAAWRCGLYWARGTANQWHSRTRPGGAKVALAAGRGAPLGRGAGCSWPNGAGASSSAAVAGQGGVAMRREAGGGQRGGVANGGRGAPLTSGTQGPEREAQVGRSQRAVECHLAGAVAAVGRTVPAPLPRRRWLMRGRGDAAGSGRRAAWRCGSYRARGTASQWRARQRNSRRRRVAHGAVTGRQCSTGVRMRRRRGCVAAAGAVNDGSAAGHSACLSAPAEQRAGQPSCGSCTAVGSCPRDPTAAGTRAQRSLIRWRPPISGAGPARRRRGCAAAAGAGAAARCGAGLPGAAQSVAAPGPES
jgi:hypothetical protein